MREHQNTRIQTKTLLPLLSTVAAVGFMAFVLWTQGRIWWCKYGDLAVYINQAWNSSHTSQHLFDPYTFTHILHGVLAFWLAGVLLKRFDMRWRFVAAVVGEAAWEVVENSSYIIEKYRENTASLDYFGDSIMNSVGDVLACAIGFAIAAKLGWWKSLAFFILVELALLVWIRDGLLLNILMLIYPMEWVKTWQLG
jgi:hypothetical protein